ncbi:MAG: elongation factor P maturation arginine rhamnosyltransferase EarP [Betaproteobacteria bacterium]
MPRQVRSWDIFCKVVDNFGDAGVCWRLARQLAAERGDAVRLWIDDLAPLARMWPEVDPAIVSVQHCAGVEIRRWTEPLPPLRSHDAVIEAFGCDIPDEFTAAMAARNPRPAWINLEYLSAEDWVESHHLLPSPHPRLPLVKYFYFPGFTARTGGLLREADLLARRDALQRDSEAQRAFWKQLGVAPPAPGQSRISLFGYSSPAVPELLSALVSGESAIHCIVAEGVLAPAIAGFFGTVPAAGGSVERGNLRLTVIPFLRQPDYDRLLWACDVNFVRGEDSLVRAQWAGRPMVWQIYPQAGDAHRPKLEAFIGRYGAVLGVETAAAAGRLFRAWNGEGDVAAAWAAADQVRAPWNAGARAWAASQAALPELMHALAASVERTL